MKRILFAIVLLALPLAARAQPIQGLYVGADGGANWMQDARVRLHTGALPGPTQKNAFHKTGSVALGSVGWAFGNGVRVEAEGDWRRNIGPAGGFSETKYGAMANVLFDMDIGSPYIYPYLGAGAGVQWVHLVGRGEQATDAAFAYQAMLGAAVPIIPVVGLSATFEYRYLGVNGRHKLPDQGGVGTSVSDDNNHALLVGLRYAFHVTPPPVAASPAAVVQPTAAPAPAAARSYLVFFDWDSAALSAKARQIIAEAAQNATRVGVTRIDVAGYADRSGTAAFNQKLSRRRAEAVAAELVRQGVAQSEIAISAFGDTHPLLPTAPGVREAQNRRVEIVLR
jgi:outer membrane protein OmpA-like peptidoglycan-associated protein